MAAKGSKKKVAARRGPLESFDADETVHSWIRLATQSPRLKKYDVRLKLSINLDAIAATEDPDRKRLIDSLVNLVKTSYVDADLMLTCAEPGGGHQSTGTVAAVGPSSAPLDATTRTAKKP